jgi:hypothetical protein
MSQAKLEQAKPKKRKKIKGFTWDFEIRKKEKKKKKRQSIKTRPIYLRGPA